MDTLEFNPRYKDQPISPENLDQLRQKFKSVIVKTILEDERLSGCLIYGSAATLFSDNLRMSLGSDIDVIAVTKDELSISDKAQANEDFSSRLKRNFESAGIKIEVDYSRPLIKGRELGEILGYVHHEMHYIGTPEFALIVDPNITDEVITNSNIQNYSF